MTDYRFKDVDQYIDFLNTVINYLGGPVAVEKILGIPRYNIYTWKSKKNFVNGKMLRKIPLHHAKTLSKKVPWATIENIRPDLYE